MKSCQCKMCGGTIVFGPGATVGVCDCCGTKLTFPGAEEKTSAPEDMTVEAEADQAREPEETKEKTGKERLGTIAAIAAVVVALIIVLIMIYYPKHKPMEVGDTEIENVEVGDTLLFGAYEQDKDTSNGKEDIEWIVLAKEENKVLIISKYALDGQPYNTADTLVTWETCSLREWLNETFINAAFSSKEQDRIIRTTVTADANPEYGTPAGNDTADKVFLLSIEEATQYFASDEARKCAPTDYAIEQGAWVSDYDTVGGRATCWWWLRSPGNFSSGAAIVSHDGSVYYGGNRVSNYGNAVRPALWIDLEP